MFELPSAQRTQEVIVGAEVILNATPPLCVLSPPEAEPLAEEG
jgi:hypothetical protein